MKRIRFWWRRRQLGIPVPFWSKPSGVSTYSVMGWMDENGDVHLEKP